MSNPGSRLRCSCRFVFGLSIISVGLVLSLAAWSQSEEPVHIVPHDPYDLPATEADAVHINGEPTLDAHMKPLRIDVDLVLVPVTVTDTMNRPVTGLHKQNFTLY